MMMRRDGSIRFLVISDNPQVYKDSILQFLSSRDHQLIAGEELFQD